MVIIIDYGMGNTGSILNMIRKVGGEAIISSDIADIERASGIVLPGVGAFDHGMKKLNELGILPVLEKRVLIDKVPFLGVCLGMQLLFSSSDEGKSKGLGWIPGSVKKFDFKNIDNQLRLKVPHMGWNIVKPKDSSQLFSGIDEELRYYFVHSFYVQCDSIEHSLATCNYGNEFTCSVSKENIFGVQFHPEKSHKFGMQLFKNYMDITLC
jgi:glutamine amidotransferase